VSVIPASLVPFPFSVFEAVPTQFSDAVIIAMFGDHFHSLFVKHA